MGHTYEKRDVLTDVPSFGLLTDLVELQGHSALAVSSRVLVQNALSDSLIDLLDRDLVSAIGLGAIAFSGSRLELLDGSLQIGLRSLIARVADLTDEDTLLGRLDIRQTKHLLRLGLAAADKKSTVQNGILAKISTKCKHFFVIF